MVTQHPLAAFYAQHEGVVVGIDEAGRGPLAGSVVAASVLLDPRRPIQNLNDSKKLTPKTRAALEVEIKAKAAGFFVAEVSSAQVDALNILRASLLAMRLSAQGLLKQWKSPLRALFVDGNQKFEPQGLPEQYCVVGGDAIFANIMAASILAKEYRDRQMVLVAQKYPGYGFEKHKGYGTKVHLEALQRLGPCPEHRRSFAPVRKLCVGEYGVLENRQLTFRN